MIIKNENIDNYKKENLSSLFLSGRENLLILNIVLSFFEFSSSKEKKKFLSIFENTYDKYYECSNVSLSGNIICDLNSFKVELKEFFALSIYYHYLMESIPFVEFKNGKVEAINKKHFRNKFNCNSDEEFNTEDRDLLIDKIKDSLPYLKYVLESILKEEVPFYSLSLKINEEIDYKVNLFKSKKEIVDKSCLIKREYYSSLPSLYQEIKDLFNKDKKNYLTGFNLLKKDYDRKLDFRRIFSVKLRYLRFPYKDENPDFKILNFFDGEVSFDTIKEILRSGIIQKNSLFPTLSKIEEK